MITNGENGLILEGGGLRSIFSAGVIDFFLDKDIQIPNVLSVSAGAYAGMNYVSGQRGRCMKAVVDPLGHYKYMGLKIFLKHGTYFDMDYLFDEVPKVHVPFDFETFCKSGKRFITGTVDCDTGEPVYFEKFDSEEEFFHICKVSNSLPLISKITYIDGRPMLDGGMADAIPIAKALQEGWQKIVIVLTRDINYRKKEKATLDIRLIKRIYRKYPKFIELVEGRAKRYNATLDKIAELEKEGRVFVIRPTEITVNTDESDIDKLRAYYQHGYDTVARRYEELLQFLQS